MFRMFLKVYMNFFVPSVMEVASGDYGDHMTRLVKSVNEGKCEKDYKSEMNGDGTLKSNFWHKPSEVQSQTMLYILQNVIQNFSVWK